MAYRGRIQQEFRLKSFRLDHDNRRDFTRSPWFNSQLPYVIYRTAVCAYQVSVYAIYHSLRGINLKSYIYLTELGFVILTLHTIVSAILCFADFFGNRPKSPEDIPMITDDDFVTTTTYCAIKRTKQSLPLAWYYKVYWVLYNVAFSTGIFITIAFWTLLVNSTGTFGILFHGINSVVIVIDVLVSGLPYRLFHFIYPSTFALTYIVFTVIYWAAGGTDLAENPYIYEVIDYGGNPGMAASTAIISLIVATPLCHGALFCLALSREKLVGFVKKRPPSDMDDAPLGRPKEGDTPVIRHANLMAQKGRRRSSGFPLC